MLERFSEKARFGGQTVELGWPDCADHRLAAVEADLEAFITRRHDYRARDYLLFLGYRLVHTTEANHIFHRA